MRSKTSHAAKSGVGEHTARESESAQCVPMGKSAWRAPTPEFGPGTARFRGLIRFKGPPARADRAAPRDPSRFSRLARSLDGNRLDWREAAGTLLIR